MLLSKYVCVVKVWRQQRILEHYKRFIFIASEQRRQTTFTPRGGVIFTRAIIGTRKGNAPLSCLTKRDIDSWSTSTSSNSDLPIETKSVRPLVCHPDVALRLSP
ncbi:hypothetical protein TGARI_310215 [Toxoplasma gondii ARI]|uniref:Uncharacterized protein n=1 Tax=Toxoplasma gondii ARI TaxID=1074872 RepID=A0A139Y7P8_TOXGO|nr:hypothetical protein TGARI_310215 [Toxoplasma gondii ARI]